MTGLELSREYYVNCCRPILERELGADARLIAAGLVGEGSDCFGYDDETSRDHDWGPRVCIWLPDGELERLRKPVMRAFALFPAEYRGYRAVHGPTGRAGVFGVGEFYKMLTGLERAPETNAQWLSITEPRLAAAVNGEVFFDGAGEFTAVRNALSAYYPEDVHLRRIAECAALAAQTGQYNLTRCRLRGEDAAAGVIKGRFAEAAAQLAFLLKKRFRPFYKWTFRAQRELPDIGCALDGLFTELFCWNDAHAENSAAEKICALLIAEMRRQGITQSDSGFLMDHIAEIVSRIDDRELAGKEISLVF